MSYKMLEQNISDREGSNKISKKMKMKATAHIKQCSRPKRYHPIATLSKGQLKSSLNAMLGIAQPVSRPPIPFVLLLRSP